MRSASPLFHRADGPRNGHGRSSSNCSAPRSWRCSWHWPRSSVRSPRRRPRPSIPPSSSGGGRAKAAADKVSGKAPLTVAFSSAGSSDPDGDALTYSWAFGGTDDITIPATNARYVRVYGTQRATAYGYSLWELEVYGA